MQVSPKDKVIHSEISKDVFDSILAHKVLMNILLQDDRYRDLREIYAIDPTDNAATRELKWKLLMERITWLENNPVNDEILCEKTEKTEKKELQLPFFHGRKKGK